MNHGTLAELIFPTRCAGCGGYAGRLLCPNCTARLPYIRGPACLRCGKPTLYDVEECGQCRGRVRKLDLCRALALYEDPLRRAIHRMKYGGIWRLARPLGFMAATSMAPHLGGGAPCVTHVPMHPRRRRSRGYDHAELLARAVAEALGLPHRTLLVRTRHAPTQASSDLKARRENVKGAFRAVDGPRLPREVLLVDDVMTTGYTLSECATALKRAGVRSVAACVLARDVAEGGIGGKGSALFSVQSAARRCR
ncbi:ComF family protein [Candidatus Solincola tengchongensis]|uniref:ComF family protein n=1 Tax=Candidatus Solincola tengchongensis TaxID=2900693 RepID=UPI00257FB1F6|nr:ComF family protein [Candidatus Solincola tengchongensis]